MLKSIAIIIVALFFAVGCKKKAEENTKEDTKKVQKTGDVKAKVCAKCAKAGKKECDCAKKAVKAAPKCAKCAKSGKKDCVCPKDAHKGHDHAKGCSKCVKGADCKCDKDTKGCKCDKDGKDCKCAKKAVAPAPKVCAKCAKAGNKECKCPKKAVKAVPTVCAKCAKAGKKECKCPKS